MQVTLAATDGGGGLGATRYTLDGSDPSESSPEYNGPFTVTGTTTVKFRSWDTAGNAESVNAQLIKLDATAPTASISSPADGAGLQGDSTSRWTPPTPGRGVRRRAVRGRRLARVLEVEGFAL